MTEPLMTTAVFVEACTRYLAALRDEHADYYRMTTDAVRQLTVAEAMAGYPDPKSAGYPSFCTAARTRLSALQRTLDDLNLRIAGVEHVVSENTQGVAA